MDFDILDQVLTKLNRRCQRESRSILLLDNAPCHPYDMKGKYPNINCVFFPPNCTSRLQPLDLGIIQSFKLKYAKLMMTHVVSLIDNCETAGDVFRSVNVLQAIRWIGQAWEDVEPSTIIKCFVTAGVLDKEGNVVEAVEPPNDEDPFADLEDEVSQVEMLLNESCGDTAVSAHEAIANESLLPVCQELGENWEERFLSSLSSDSNGNNEGADSDDIVRLPRNLTMFLFFFFFFYYTR